MLMGSGAGTMKTIEMMGRQDGVHHGGRMTRNKVLKMVQWVKNPPAMQETRKTRD